MKTMLQLKGLQGISSTVQGNTTSLTSTSDLFQQVLQTALQSQLNTTTSNGTLGNVYQQLQSFTFPSVNRISSAPLPKDSTTTIPTDLESIIGQASRTFGLPKELISAVIQTESNYQSNAVSHAGASGLMQLMPKTAASLGVTDIFNPTQNVMAGSKYLRQMLDQFDQDLDLALAAYNAGPGNVQKYGGIPPFKETIQYVQKVKMQWSKTLYEQKARPSNHYSRRAFLYRDFLFPQPFYY